LAGLPGARLVPADWNDRGPFRIDRAGPSASGRTPDVKEDQMGYDRNDRFAPGNDDRGRDRHYDRGERGYRGGGYGRPPQGYANEDRGFLDRAGDELRSWFGDEDAERRRHADEREEHRRPREYGRNHGRFGEERGYTPNDAPDRADTQTRHGTGMFGQGEPADAGHGWSQRQRDDDRNHGHDPSYRSWRDRQMAAFDRDYEEYRRENQSRFDSEWSSWRQTREKQRSSLGQVHEHQEVVGSDGVHVGTVDKVQGDRILLNKADRDAGGHHHSIPVGWIQNVGEKVEISKTADQAHAAWRDEDRDRQESAGLEERDVAARTR
jgi:hypothetical protein